MGKYGTALRLQAALLRILEPQVTTSGHVGFCGKIEEEFEKQNTFITIIYVYIYIIHIDDVCMIIILSFYDL